MHLGSPVAEALGKTMWFLHVVMTAGIVVIFFRRRHLYPMTVMPIWWLILGHISTPWGAFIYLSGFFHTPCNSLMIFLIYTGGYFPAVPTLFVQCFMLYYNHRHQHQQIAQRRQSKDKADNGGSSTGTVVQERKDSQQLHQPCQAVSPLARLAKLVSGLTFQQRRELYASMVFLAGMIITLPYGGLVVKTFHQALRADEPHPELLFDLRTCRLQATNVLLVNHATIFFIVLIMMGTYWKLRSVQEAFSMKKQFMRLALYTLGVVLPVQVIKALLGVHGPFWLSFAFYFTSASLYLVYEVTCGIIPIIMSYKEERRKLGEQISWRKNDGGGPRSAPVKSCYELRYILMRNNVDVMEGFQEYLVKEFCVENILFFRAIISFRGISRPSDLLSAAHSIARRFILSGTSTEINISDSLRRKTLNRLETATESTMSRDFFEAVEGEVLTMMVDPFNRFLARSHIYVPPEAYQPFLAPTPPSPSAVTAVPTLSLPLYVRPSSAATAGKQ